MPPLPPVTSAILPDRSNIVDKSKYLSEDAPMRVDAVRRFNRFYTRRVGALREGLLGSPYPLPEARLIYELGQRGKCSASELCRDLDLDPGYLSRLLQALRKRALVRASASAGDARRRLLSLTPAGRKAFSLLDRRSREEVAGILTALPAAAQARLVDAMRTVETLLAQSEDEPRIALRGHRPGDLGWVVHRHGALYAQEYGYDERFEALVAGIVAKFVRDFDPSGERCWIAEADGVPVGSVFVVRQSKSTAKLRLLLVEPHARGRGLGRRLVEECIRFSREKGYRRLVLWTQSDLDAARAVYRACGFRLARSEQHASFGIPLTGEYWQLRL
jgi:DNA-binding MarR family transcriptional regulator/GNAT superfamily N-acetyltransferase